METKKQTTFMNNLLRKAPYFFLSATTYGHAEIIKKGIENKTSVVDTAYKLIKINKNNN